VHGASARANLKWRRGDMSHFHVVAKRDGRVLPATFTCEPFFFFNVINAFERGQGEQLVLDILAYKDAEVGDRFIDSCCNRLSRS